MLDSCKSTYAKKKEKKFKSLLVSCWKAAGKKQLLQIVFISLYATIRSRPWRASASTMMASQSTFCT